MANGCGQRLGDPTAGTEVHKLRPRDCTSPLADTALLPNYQVMLPQVALLADHDVALVCQLIHQAKVYQNYKLLNGVANKVRVITGIQTDLQDASPFWEPCCATTRIQRPMERK